MALLVTRKSDLGDFYRNYRKNILAYIKKISSKEDLRYVNKNISDEQFKEIKEITSNFIDYIENNEILYDIKYEECSSNTLFAEQTYTGVCPTRVFIMNPSYGICTFGCLYCLAGTFNNKISKEIIYFTNFHKIVETNLLKLENENVSACHYLSPLSDPFQPQLISSGIIFNILKAISVHFKKFPNSKQRVFIATKAGYQVLFESFCGTTIMELLKNIPREKIELVVSIGVLPQREIFEPFAASYDDRIKLIKIANQSGIRCELALIQPIFIPYCTTPFLDNLFSDLKNAGIKIIKPEVATTSLGCAALIAQVLKAYNESLAGNFLSHYLTSDVMEKGRSGRFSPNSETYKECLSQIQAQGQKYDFKMILCHWIKMAACLNCSTISFIKNRSPFWCC